MYAYLILNTHLICDMRKGPKKMSGTQNTNKGYHEMSVA